MKPAHLRDHSLPQIIRGVAFGEPPVSRSTLARSAGLTKPTVSKIVGELLDSGLLEEGEPLTRGTGRPMVPLRVRRAAVLGIGMEIATDRVSALAIDLPGDEIDFRTDLLDVRREAPRAILRRGASLVRSIIDENPQSTVIAVGVAVPGRVSPDGSGILAAPGLGWEDVPVLGPLQELLGPPMQELQVTNENQLAVLQEMWHRKQRTFIYLRGDTGVGGAVVLEGRILDGDNGWAGEIGHTIVIPDGAACLCGRRGCLEAYTSLSALLKRAGLPAHGDIDDVVEHLSRGEGAAGMRSLVGRCIGIAIANALNVLDISTVVFSGHLAPLAAELAPEIHSTVDRLSLAAESGSVDLARSDGFESPALWGAARKAIEPFFSQTATWVDRVRERSTGAA